MQAWRAPQPSVIGGWNNEYPVRSTSAPKCDLELSAKHTLSISSLHLSPTSSIHKYTPNFSSFVCTLVSIGLTRTDQFCASLIHNETKPNNKRRDSSSRTPDTSHFDFSFLVSHLLSRKSNHLKSIQTSEAYLMIANPL